MVRVIHIVERIMQKHNSFRLIKHFRIDRVLPDRLAVEYAEYVVSGLHRHANARHVRRNHEICDLQEWMIRRRRSGSYTSMRGEVTRFVSCRSG